MSCGNRLRSLSLFFKCDRLERHLKYHHNLLEQLQNVVEDKSSDELERVSNPFYTVLAQFAVSAICREDVAREILS